MALKSAVGKRAGGENAGRVRRCKGEAGFETRVPLPTNVLCSQNPALRHELSFEMGQVHSDMALHFGNNRGDPANKGGPVLSREGQVCPPKARPEVLSHQVSWEMLNDVVSSRKPSTP